MKIFKIILRVFLGLVFIVSAILKLFPIEAFDAKILEQMPVLGWTLSAVAARTFIGIEFTLGVFLISGLCLKRIIYPCTIALLGFFTLFLIYSLIKFGNQPNCGCFGEWLPFTNIESLVKNIVLLAIVIFLYLHTEHLGYRYWWTILIVLAVSIFLVFWTHKIVVYVPEWKLNKEVKVKYLHQTEFSQTYTDLHKKHLMIMVTPTCKACQKLVKDLKTMNYLYGFHDTYMFINTTNINDVDKLYPKKDPDFSYMLLEEDTFSHYVVAPYMPLIMLVDSMGIIRNLWTTANFNFDKIIPFFQEEGLLGKQKDNFSKKTQD